MRNREHIGLVYLLGGIIGVILYFVGLFDYIYYMIPMLFTTILPDIIEPATDYKHRRFFHSKRILKFLSAYCLPAFFILGLIFNFFFYVFFGVVGYVLHLLGDWTAPMGLPE